ncbi:MAG TPA: isoaspartyl peptidase/L-asparaginase [Solirubrobacteraceae bacterium]|nr:isoaspartyl peptidase/L-asparaginase [Solirubrobacteraceae bacterium]
MRPVLVIHAGAGPRSPWRAGRAPAMRDALLEALRRGRDVLERPDGAAIDAVQAAVEFMEDGCELFNAGRGSALCADGTVEMSASIMRGSDRAAGAAALLRRTRQPIAAARAVLERSPHVLVGGDATDAFAARHGLEQREPGYFVTEHQRGRLADAGSDFERGTVGAVCVDAAGELVAGTSTGGRRGQMPGRVGDTPLIGAGTWADRRVAVSCTGEGEAFIRAAAAHLLALRVEAGATLQRAADEALADVGAVDGVGGLIAIDADGGVAMPFTSEVMNRAVWRAGEEPDAWV